MDISPYYKSTEEYSDHGYCIATASNGKSEYTRGFEESLRADIHDTQGTKYYEKLNSYYKSNAIASQDDTLIFESRFESGNLRRAVQVDKYEYDLYLKPDHGTTNITQWFYFRLGNTRKYRTYQLHIVNFQKPESSFNDGMKVLLYSKKYAEQRNMGWIRIGEDISYYPTSINKQRTYHLSQTTGMDPQLTT